MTITIHQRTTSLLYNHDSIYGRGKRRDRRVVVREAAARAVADWPSWRFQALQ